MKHDESQLQIELVQLFRTKIQNMCGSSFVQLNKTFEVINGNCFLTSTRNEEKSTIQGAVRLKQLGMLSGISDLILFYVEDKIVKCVFLELKTQEAYEKDKKNHGLRDTQIKFRDMVETYLPNGDVHFIITKPSEFLNVLVNKKILKNS